MNRDGGNRFGDGEKITHPPIDPTRKTTTPADYNTDNFECILLKQGTINFNSINRLTIHPFTHSPILMPHLILEYTDNVKFDHNIFFERLHHALVETGAVRLKGLKSRAIKLTDYVIADGNPEYRLVHLTMVMREGRPREIKEEIAQILMAHLEETFGHYSEGAGISISNDMQELQFGIALTSNNIPILPES